MLQFQPETKKVSIDFVNSFANITVSEIIQTSENYYKKCVTMSAERIIDQNKNFVLLTGPSASGKTTTSILICNKLTEMGKKAMRVSMDNFYKNRNEALPTWEDGSKNFEAIEALDLDCIESTLRELFQKKTAEFPIFDFAKGARSNKTFTINYDKDTIIIFEGIHALHPVFDQILKEYNCMRIYVSAHSDFVDSDGNIVLPARDLRLIRRCLRDKVERATPSFDTILLWEKVCRGEDIYIRPYRNNADIHINSTHNYEPLVYKNAFIKMSQDELMLSRKIDLLSKSLSYFSSSSPEVIPNTSLLREFINSR